MAYPKPICDWRDESAYPANGGMLDGDQWAWEFLRRNPEYQRHWDIFESLPDVSPEVGNKNGKWRGLPHEEQVLTTYHGYVNPPPLENETYNDFLTRNENNDEAEVIPYSDFMCQRFKICPIPESYLQDSPRAIEFTGDLVEGHEHDWPALVSLKFDDGVNEAKKICESNPFSVVLVFDLRASIDAQAQEAKKCLHEHRSFVREHDVQKVFATNRMPQPKPNAFPAYIRLLDAKASGGQTNSKIASVIYPHLDEKHEGKDQVKRHFRSACVYRDLKYFTLSKGGI